MLNRLDILDNTYWMKNGAEQGKYDEMVINGFEFTEKTKRLFHSYYRWYNDGDIPAWAHRSYVFIKKADNTLSEMGLVEFEIRVTNAILAEYKRFKNPHKGRR